MSEYYNLELYNKAKYKNTLYTLRIKANLTQIDMAEKLEISQASYCRNEAGSIKKVPKELADKICKLFGIPLSDLLEPITPANKEEQKFYIWLNSKEAEPYLKEAYAKFLEDEDKKLKFIGMKFSEYYNK